MDFKSFIFKTRGKEGFFYKQNAMPMLGVICPPHPQYFGSQQKDEASYLVHTPCGYIFHLVLEDGVSLQFLEEKCTSRISMFFTQHLSCQQLKAFCLVASTGNSLKVQSDQISTVALILKEKGHFCLRV